MLSTICTPEDGNSDLAEFVTSVADNLHKNVAAMNVDNFLVRPHRRQVEKFRERAAWKAWHQLTHEDLNQLIHNIARLPTGLPSEEETAKQFDLLILRLQLARLNHTPDFNRWETQVREIAQQLEERSTIPMVNDHIDLIRQIQEDEYWTDVTVPMLELVRLRLRDLVKFIEKRKRTIVYADFKDTLGQVAEVDSLWLGTEYNIEQYRKRMRHFLRAHENHLTVNKLKRNVPITASELQDLERLLFESGELGNKQDFERAFGGTQSLGELVRSIVGLDRAAAVQAFGEFLSNMTYNAKQIQFVNQIIDYLTQNGVMDPGLLYEAPFTDISNNGLDGVFAGHDADKIVEVLRQIKNNAAA